MKRSFFIAAFLAVAAVGWIASGQFGHSDNLPEAKKPPADLSHSDRLPMVRVREIVAEPHQAETVLRGLSQAVRMVNVKSETYGRIVELSVERGDLVEDGQIIARLAPESRPARLADARALKAQRSIEYEAAKKLSAKGYRAETSLAGAKAQLEAASAAVHAAQVALDDVIVKAPFAGIVDDRMVEIGDYLETGDGLVQLVDLDPILIVAQVNERDIGLLQVGQVGTARLTTGARVEGILRFISNVADATTRTFRVELEVANPKFDIPDGVTAELRLTSPHILAHHVSPAILSLDDRGLVGVKTLTPEHTVRFVPVTVIESDAAGLWLSGLSEQAVVITVGQDFVRDGQKVRPIDAETLRPFGNGMGGGDGTGGGGKSGGDGLGS